jgi:hypothetical protein
MLPATIPQEPSVTTHPTLTTEQILALAPDAAAAAAGRGLAVARVWASLGRGAGALWGECKGSAKKPYRTQVDLSGPAFRCSCPSRKFPCKHGLGLLLLLAASPELAPAAEPPPWVAEWLAGRARAARGQPRQEADAKPRAGRAGRAAGAREARVAAGMEELELWLRDRVRAGLAALQAEAPAAFEALAARMVDAQAPGAARLLRLAGAIATSGPGWQGRLLDRLARLHLLARAYGALDGLPPDSQADVRAALGFTQSREELLAGPGVRDRWVVLGRTVEDEERLRVQRTWLWGAGSRRAALVLEFSAGGQPLDRSLVPGLCLDAELVFYPSAAPARALVRARHGDAGMPPPLPAGPLREATGAYAAALAANPWTERALLIVGPCRLAQAEGRWHACDDEGRAVPLPARFAEAWRLLALTGGTPLTLAGEWDGETLAPLCAQQGERLIALGNG